jgi:NAD+ synthase
MEMAVEKKSDFDADFEIARIIHFLKTQVESSASRGYVVGMSGGIDSAVVASLCQRSVGAQNVLCLRLFEDFHKGSQDFLDAGNIIEQLGVRSADISLSPLVEAFETILRSKNVAAGRVTKGNIKARLRMVLLYTFANQEKYLVAGTGDKSEDLLGFFTKYGDGGVDNLPIAHLYKGQVRELGRRLGLPESVVMKPSSPNLWEGHKATDEIPADYTVLDPIMTLMFDRNLGPLEISKRTGVSISLIDEVIKKNLQSRHKRVYPSMVTSW